MLKPRRFIFTVLLLSVILIPVRGEEVTMQYNGLTLNANLEMAGGKDYSDGIFLVLHGYLAHNRMEVIRTIQQVLMDNEHSSLAINLSFKIDNRHGFYDCNQPQHMIQDDSIDELSAWVDWLRRQGTERITLIGHSRASNQIMAYAVEKLDPEVTHLILMAPGMTDFSKSYRERYGYSLDQPLALAYEKINRGKGDELMRGVDTIACPQASVTANSFVSYHSKNNPFTDQFGRYLAKTPVPTLIVTGTEDERQPNTVALLSRYADNEHIEVSVIDGAGHFFRDLNMDEAMEVAIEFIER